MLICKSYKLIIGLIIFSIPTFAQYRQNPSYIKYIREYSDLAVEHQKKYKIPASITLAQGLLESGAGRGRLAKEANNHFGIKCHNWDGPRIFQDDDRKDDCFRKYSDPKDSYLDHSLFLVGRPRYKELFQLSPTDYRNWAKGLQKCGYATDRAYANKLIKIIEDYELYAYDKKRFVRPKSNSKDKFNNIPAPLRPVYINQNKQLYIIAKANDSFEEIAREFDIRASKLRKYNEVPDDYPLQEGDVIYLQKKAKKASSQYHYHTVDVGESMHSISQLYGIRMKYLYKMNHKDFEYVPTEGDLLRVR